ncbi:MAG: alpha/beta hydrolase [Planctomycetota bacterium]
MKLQGVFVGVIAGVMLSGCTAKTTMMSVPVMFALGQADPYGETVPKGGPNVEVYYATNREVDEDNDSVGRYLDGRGKHLKLGKATVRIGPEGGTWDEARERSFDRWRDRALPIEVVDIDEKAVLRESISWLDDAYDDPETLRLQQQFARTINDALEASEGDDITIFVAPFKVDFNTAVLTAAEFHHFGGRKGVFLAYSWPTKLGTLDYFSATESAYAGVRDLRILIEFLADSTSARKIHLMTYSAGARVLSYALHELRLQVDELDLEEARSQFRIGQVIFTGPDIEWDLFTLHYQDGMPELADQITIYTTPRDKALGMSQWVFGWQRLGQVEAEDLGEQGRTFIEEQEHTNFVSVTNTERIERDNSHGYFRRSPWVSSDIVLILTNELLPGERGLQRTPGDPIWRFPAEYASTVPAIAEEHFPIRDVR